jgi:lipopolysaccharide transport system ATP-binding protein
MNDTRLKVENISKQYRLGEIGTGTLSHDINRYWHKIRGKENPYSLVTEVNNRTIKGSSDYVWAIDNVNFEVKEGEVLGVIGRNGAGKSTLLKILSKVTGPTKGKIIINGRIGSLLEVGTGMHPELTGKENIYLNGAILGMSKAEITSKLDEIIEFAGVEKYVDTPFKRYSSGMRVRLGFAVAAFLEPEILIVDEVLAVGDAEFQKKAIGKMKEISKEGRRTVLFVSHNMGSIRSLCDRCILMDHGQVIFDGITDDCIREYLTINMSEKHADLLKVKERNGNGKLKFNSVELFDNLNNLISEGFSGDFLKIRIGFNVYQKIFFDKLILAIGIRDAYENDVVSYVTDEMGVRFSPIDLEKGYFIIEIPQLMLRGGRYYLRLLAMENDTNPENFLDELNSIVSFNVIGSDYWNSGKTMRNSESCFMDGTISLEV